MLTDQPVGWRLVTDQAVNRSHADIQVVVRRVGILRRRQHFIQLANKLQPDADPVLYTPDEWTEFVDNARHAVRDEDGAVRIGGIKWTKAQWDALLFAVARGAFMMLAHIPRAA